MDPADVIIVSLALSLVAATGVGLVRLCLFWIRGRSRIRELEAQLQHGESLHDARVDALEIAVENLTAQLEQVASGQEFLNRVVANRIGPVPIVSPTPPVITPH